MRPKDFPKKVDFGLGPACGLCYRVVKERCLAQIVKTGKGGSGKRKIQDLASDDLRRIFKKSLDDFLKENADDIGEKPTKNEQSDMVGDMLSLWQDVVESVVDTAVDQYCGFLLDPVNEEEDEDEEADSEASDEAED